MSIANTSDTFTGILFGPGLRSSLQITNIRLPRDCGRSIPVRNISGAKAQHLGLLFTGLKAGAPTETAKAEFVHLDCLATEYRPFGT